MSSIKSTRKPKFTKKDFKESIKENNAKFKDLRKIKNYIIYDKMPDFCKPNENIDEGEKRIKELYKQINEQYKLDMVDEVNKDKNVATGFSAPTYVDYSLCELMNRYIDDDKLKIKKKETNDAVYGILNRVLAGQFIAWYVRRKGLTSRDRKVSKTYFRLNSHLMKIFGKHIKYLKKQIKEKKKNRAGITSSRCAAITEIDGKYWINYSALQILITPLFQSKYTIPYREKYNNQLNAIKEIFAKPKKEPKKKKEKEPEPEPEEPQLSSDDSEYEDTKKKSRPVEKDKSVKVPLTKKNIKKVLEESSSDDSDDSDE